MKKLGERLAALIDVKSIMTFFIIGTLCFLAVKQNTEIPSELLAAVISSVTTYFFTKKNSGGSNDGTST